MENWMKLNLDRNGKWKGVNQVMTQGHSSSISMKSIFGGVSYAKGHSKLLLRCQRVTKKI